MRLLPSWRPFAALASVIAVAVPLACGSDDDSLFHDGADAGNDAASGSGNNITFDPNGDAQTGDPSPNDGSDASTGITMRIRDFKFYSATDSTTNADFENPPYGINQSGQQQNGYSGDWNDRSIVTDTLGADNKPVYGTHSGDKTLTTHGAASFAQWFNNVGGANIAQDIPLATTVQDGGVTEYDSNKSGQPQDPNNPTGMRGFFPIDDGTMYATTFGNQSKPHNYSFTGEIHAAFTYHGGETFHFRGDDDVWVYINKKRVIDIGGIHSPETADVSVDTLGLTVGTDYQLDFFFAERHVTGSNVLFQTTLALRAAPPGGIK